MNSKVVNTIMAIVVVGLSLGCQSEEFQVSEDGYQYKYITKGAGEVPKQGEVVVYNMTYKNEKDSILGESTAGQPFMIPCDTMQWNMGGALYKAFAMIKEGDSILIKIPTQQVYTASFRSDVPPSMDPQGEITFYIGASKILTMQEAQAEAAKMRQKQQEEMLAASQEQMDKDIEIIDAYLKENNIEAQSTESGLRYVIETEGSGASPAQGQMVFVHYTGTLLDGKQFDSSHDRGEPLDFPIGQGNVIPGWDEGIALLKKGGKGTLYIPSPLAYGPRGAGADIPPNAVLKFDVELVDIN